MKINKIEICNLASIDGEYTINFDTEPLRSAGLFAITGRTGAGKSTLLDAVCLALYNKAPRFDGVERTKRLDGSEAKKGELQSYDTRNMMRRGRREASCAVTFTASDAVYCASWSVRLKRTDNYDSVVRTLKRLKPSQKTYETSEIEKTIQDVIGLDYEQFTRTVVLAQNSFANFLKARQADKSVLLEKLTGTEIYGRISKAIFALSREAEQKLSLENKKLEGIKQNILDEEDLKRAKEQMDFAQSRLRMIDERLESIALKQTWYTVYEEAVEKMRQTEAEQMTVKKEVAAVFPQKELLSRYDEVVSIQPLFQEIKVLEKSIEESREQIRLITSKVAEQRKKTSEAEAALELARVKNLEKREDFKQIQPKLNRGHSLKGEIIVAEKDLAEKVRNLDTITVALKEKKKVLEEKSKELADMNRKQDILKQRLQALSPQASMLEQTDLILLKLNRLDELVKERKDFNSRMDILNKKMIEISGVMEKSTKEKTDIISQLNAMQNETFVHLQSNSGIDGAQLQQKVAMLYDNQRELKGAQELWNRISRNYENIETASDEISRHRVRIDGERKNIDELQKNIDVLTATCERMNTAYTLSQSKDMKNLRQRLKEGTACPVCGATHHPYHTETEQELGELLNSLEKEYRETSEELKLKLQTQDELKRVHATGIGKLKAEQDFLLIVQKQLEEDKEKWGDYVLLDSTFADCSASVNRNARRLMIEALRENVDRVVKEAQKQLDAYGFHQQTINELRGKIENLRKLRDEHVAKENEAVTSTKLVNASIDELGKLITQNVHLYTDVYEELDKTLTIASWFATWEKGHDAFCMQLMKTSKEWKELNSLMADYGQREYRLKEEMKTAQTSYSEAEHSYRTLQDDKYKSQELLREKEKEFVALFGRYTLEETSELYNSASERAMAELEERQKAYDTISSELQTYLGKQQNMETSLSTQWQSLRSKRSELDVWILAFNNEHNPLQVSELEKIFSSSYNWNGIRKIVAEKDAELIRIKEKMDAARRRLLAVEADHNAPSSMVEESKAALTADKEQMLDKKKNITSEFSALSMKMQMHEHCQEQVDGASQHLLSLQEDKEDWEQLCSLIGSADGKKFREQAQCYTFRFLVDYANAHLESLSPRYRLQTASNSLSLEIIDRDMFDEVRSVNSLSGGETFIVSLGLALALSSLSSCNLSIESLFIDEGFGNLDSESLELVMDTLGNLQGEQGRKVGVISHTEQIKTRISPQIQLIKLPAGGKSRIEII